MSAENWKPKTTDATKKSDAKISSSLEVLKNYRKRGRENKNKDILKKLKELKEKLESIDDARHNIREKRILQHKYKELQKQLDKKNIDVTLIDNIMASQRNKKVKKQVKRSRTDDETVRRRPSSHSRTIKVSQKKHSDENMDIMMEDLVADLQPSNYVPPVFVSVSGNCPECNSIMQKLSLEAMMCCSNCGISLPYLDSTTRASCHGDDRSYPSFSYKKINHFRDWLRSVQAKESTTISPEIMAQVCQKCVERNINPQDLTPKKVREILKLCRLRKYYENSVLIHSLMTGVQPPRFEPETEARLEQMFMQIAAPFNLAVREVCPERKNFLSYAFVCFKFVQLLPDVDNSWLQSFALLKGRDKLYKQDQIWKHICGQLGWKFYPSV